MPRGNDAKAAYEELRERYDDGLGSAEDSLRAARAALPEELRRASLKQVDTQATLDLDFDKVAKQADAHKVLDAVVRGGDIVYVAVDENGRTHKGVIVGGDDHVVAEDKHLNRIRSLSEKAEEAAKEKPAKDSGPSETQKRAKAKREKAIEQAAQEGSLRAKARNPQEVQDQLDEETRSRGSEDSSDKDSKD